MALIECAECGKQVSDKAASCPNCGAPFRESHDAGNEKKKPSGCLFILVLLGVLLLVFVLLPSPSRSPRRDAQPATPAFDNTAAQAAALDKFNGLPGVSRAEWLDGNLTLQAFDNGQSWRPVADAACAWLRQQGYRGEVSVDIIEAAAVRNKRWEQLAHSRCN